MSIRSISVIRVPLVICVLFVPDNLIHNSCKTLDNLNHLDRDIRIGIVGNCSYWLIILLYGNGKLNGLLNLVSFNPSDNNGSLVQNFGTERWG